MSNLLDTIREATDIEDEVLADIGLRDYTVSLRTSVITGGDIDKGIKGGEVITDTPLSPVPKLTIASLSWTHKTNGYIKEGDILMTISAKNYTKTQLTLANFVYESNVYKSYEVTGQPDMSMPLRWKVLARKVG